MPITSAQPEEVRNRLLRRTDWRFLLPNPRPAKSICFANGSLAEAVELISEQVVPVCQAHNGDCDLAVTVNPSQATLRAAWSALTPAGSLYTEWYSPLAGGPKQVRRRLEAMGFEAIRCYWPWPWPARGPSLFWLPLEAPGALDHFLSSRPKPRPILRRYVNTLGRFLWRLFLRIGLTLPVCATARKSDSSVGEGSRAKTPKLGTDNTLPVEPNTGIGLRDVIHSGWASWGFGTLPDHFSWLLLTGGPRSISKVVGLVFAEPDHQPRLAVKMARVPEALTALDGEATALQSVQLLSPRGMPGVPRLLFRLDHPGFIALGETFLTGVPLGTLLHRHNYRELALKATRWLGDLAGQATPLPRATWWHRLVESVLVDFSTSFGPVVDAGMLRETRAILSTLGDLPIVCEQRDFSPWNILLTPDGSLAVLDWESAELQGLPGMDLIYFLSYLAFFLDGAMDSGHFRDSYRAAMDPSTLTGSVTHECLTCYSDQLGLKLDSLEPIRLLVWLLHSRSEYQHITADAGGKPQPEVLRRSLFVRLWKEELRYYANKAG